MLKPQARHGEKYEERKKKRKKEKEKAAANGRKIYAPGMGLNNEDDARRQHAASRVQSMVALLFSEKVLYLQQQQTIVRS